jgi:hypothetical protein
VNLRRVAPTDWAVGASGAVLIGSLWLHWYRSHGSYTAWQAMSVNDVLLLIAGGLAVVLVLATATQYSGAVPIAAATFVALGGVIASILTVVRLIWPPDLGPGPTDRAAGVWVGTAAALALAVTGWLDMRDERRGAHGSTQVDVTALPAPRIREEGT